MPTSKLIEKTTEVAPGITLIALYSTPRHQGTRGLSLAVNTADGLVLLVACSHPGIEKIVEAAVAINPKNYLIAGGFHLVTAPDEHLRTVAALKDTFKVGGLPPFNRTQGYCDPSSA